MRIPQWVTLAVAAVMIGFGCYRLYLAFKKTDPDSPRRGFYAMSKRAHLVIGTVYVLLGAALVATSFGWSPFGLLAGPDRDAPTQTAPGSAGQPVQLDQPK